MNFVALSSTSRINNRKRWRRTLFGQMIVAIIAICLLLPDQQIVDAAPHQRRSYSLRKGSRLERHHRKSLHEWRRALTYSHPPLEKRRHHHHKKKLRIHHMDLDEILNQMDSIQKPRFGR